MPLGRPAAGRRSWRPGDYYGGRDDRRPGAARRIPRSRGSARRYGHDDPCPRAAMNHARQLIREAVAGRITGLPITGSRVYQSRVYALAAGEVPCLLVYTLAEEIVKPVFCHPGELARALSVAIEAVAAANADLDDTLDSVCAEVETELGSGDFTLGGRVSDLVLQRTEIQLQGGDSPRPLGIARMTWLMRYATREGDPTTTL